MNMAGKERVRFSATNILDNLEKVILPEAKAENGLLCCFEEGILKLKRNIACIKDMLSHADHENDSIPIRYIIMQPWLRELMDVLDEADILVNDVKGKIPESHAHGAGALRKVSNFFSFNVQMAIRIRAINNKLNDQIAFHKIATTHGDATFQLAKRPQKNPFLPDHLNPSNIIGRDKDAENIVRVLVDYSLGLTVLPILGTQGLGKTTLAGLVYNHKMVNEVFELKIWVPVESYDLMGLVRRILEAVGYGRGFNDVELQVMNDFYHMVQVLLHYLGGRRYLLVLDGWEVYDMGTWMDLKDLLMNGADGSKIIVTTRRRDVAQLMGTIPPYILRGLSMEDSLSLLFQGRLVSDSVPPDVKDIGMKIVEKCQGVPSVIKEMGKSLDWMNSVRESEMREKTQLFEELLMLKTSYFNDPLDEKFKECFKYCSFFPQNHEFNSTFELIQFWDACDLLGIGSNYEDTEDLGMKGLESLLSRSWLKVCGEEFFCKKFKIPPLQYHFAHKFLVQDEFKMNPSSTEARDRDGSTRLRHLLFVGSDSELSSQQDNWSLSLNAPWWFLDIGSINIKTLMIFIEKIDKYSMESFIGRCTDLRVLILRDSRLEVLPSGIKGLKHLKYLDLTGNKEVKEVPNSICMLYNLQTLILEGCVEVKELPRDIRYLGGRLTMLVITTKQRFLPENGVGKLTSLRYLAIIGCPELKYLPQGIFLLTSLRTFIIRDCRSLISLPRSMKSLMALKTVVISSCQELLLRTEFDGDENPYLGHLQGTGLSLRQLWIAKLPNLSSLPQWFFGKSLEQLHIEDCQELKRIPGWLEDLTSLANIQILNCQNLSYPGITLSSSILKNAKIEDCPHLTQSNYETQIATNTNKGAKGKGVRVADDINFEAAEPAMSSLGLQNRPLQRGKLDAGTPF